MSRADADADDREATASVDGIRMLVGVGVTSGGLAVSLAAGLPIAELGAAHPTSVTRRLARIAVLGRIATVSTGVAGPATPQLFCFSARQGRVEDSVRVSGVRSTHRDIGESVPLPYPPMSAAVRPRALVCQ